MQPYLKKLGIKAVPMIAAWDIYEMRKFWANVTHMDKFIDDAVREAVKKDFYGYNVIFYTVFLLTYFILSRFFRCLCLSFITINVYFFVSD
jgi:hypothetical protein